MHVDPDALAVKQHEVDGLDGGRHGGHKITGDGLEDQLGCRLLRETIPDGRVRTHLVKCGLTRTHCRDCHYVSGKDTHEGSYLLGTYYRLNLEPSFTAFNSGTNFKL